MTATTHRLRDRWPETGSYDLVRVIRDTRANNRVVEVHLTTIPAETAEQAMQAAIRWLDSRWQSHGTRWAKVPGRTGSWALRGPMVCGRPRHLLSSDGMCELCRPKRGPRPAGRCGDQVVDAS